LAAAHLVVVQIMDGERLYGVHRVFDLLRRVRLVLGKWRFA
jgi:hypothetical protein